MWPHVTILTTCENCDMWQLWPQVTIVTACDNFDNMWQMWPHVTILTTIMITCDNIDHMIIVILAMLNKNTSVSFKLDHHARYLVNHHCRRSIMGNFHFILVPERFLGWTHGFLLLHIYSKIQMRHKKRQDASKVGLYDFNEAQHDAPMIEVALLLHDKPHQALFKSESPTPYCCLKLCFIFHQFCSILGYSASTWQ